MKPQNVILLTEGQKHVLRDALRVGVKRSGRPGPLPQISPDEPKQPMEKPPEEKFAVHCMSS